MYKNLIGIVLLSLLVGGCGEPSESGLTNIEVTRIASGDDYLFVNSRGEPVLLVAGEEITPDDIINKPVNYGGLFITPIEFFEPNTQSIGLMEFKETLKETGYMQIILADKISEILLYKTAKKEIGDTLDEYLEKSIESEINRRVQQFGGDEVKADEVIKERWHDRETYRNLIKNEILTQWYISTQKKEAGFIPYRQLIRKYESMKAESFAITPEIEFRSIDIIPSRLSIPDPNLDQRTYAEDLANELYARLKSGEDFGQLAEEYSHGHRRKYGGLWDSINPEDLAEPFDVIAKTAMNMNPGEISEPIKTKSYIFIIKLEKKIPAGYVPFEQVQKQVREALLEEQNKTQALSRLEESINQQMERFETNAFIDFCLEKIYKESSSNK